MNGSRLKMIQQKAQGKVQVVLHGTNEFSPEIMKKCIEHGCTRINVNKLVLSPYLDYTAEYTGKKPTTTVMDESAEIIRKSCEEWMDIIGSSGEA